MSRQLAAAPRETGRFDLSDDILTLQPNLTLEGQLVNVQSVSVQLSCVSVTPAQVRP